MLHSKHGAKFWARLPQPLRPWKSQIENESETLRRILARGFQSMPQSFEPVFFSLVVPGNLKLKTGLKLRDVFGTLQSKCAANFWALLFQPHRPRQPQLENGPKTLRLFWHVAFKMTGTN